MSRWTRTCVTQHVAGRTDQHRRSCSAAGFRPVAGEVLFHLRAIFGAERSWKEVQQRAIETHLHLLCDKPARAREPDQLAEAIGLFPRDLPAGIS
jgi:hypothetical protein